MKIRLLALDLDDTLLRSDLTISERNRQAIRQAEAKGVVIVLASGRAVAAMSKFAEELGMFGRPGFMISDNGSTVTDTLTGETLVSHVLEPPLLHQLLEEMEIRRLPVQVYEEGFIKVTRDNPITDEDVQLSGLPKKVVPDIVPDLADWPRKLVIPGDPAVLPGLRDHIRARYGHQVNTFVSKPFFLEILPGQADKGSAVKYVADKLHLVREQVMVMGDAANDLGMITFAGWGVAMANALPEIKQAAKIVTQADHNDDGVAEIIEDYILSRP